MPQKPVLTYPKTPVNKLNRMSQRGSYDTTTVHTIVNSSLISHISFVDPHTQSHDHQQSNQQNGAAPAVPPIPSMLPMITRMGSYAYPSSSLSDPLDLYFHTSVSSRLARLIASSPSGFPVTIASTKVDGIVLALTPFNHSYNYRSAVVFGTARLVEDKEEKLWALEFISEDVTFVGNWERTRLLTEEELKAVAVVRVKVSTASAKVRVGESGDDKKDRGDDELRNRTWSGVVPIFEKFGKPVGSSYNALKEVPEHIRVGMEEKDKKEREYAQKVAKKQD